MFLCWGTKKMLYTQNWCRIPLSTLSIIFSFSHHLHWINSIFSSFHVVQGNVYRISVQSLFLKTYWKQREFRFFPFFVTSYLFFSQGSWNRHNRFSKNDCSKNLQHNPTRNRTEKSTFFMCLIMDWYLMQSFSFYAFSGPLCWSI